MILKAYRIIEGHPERIDIDVNSRTYWIVRRKLELERLKIIAIFTEMENEGIIKSIRKPANKKQQDYINELVEAKRNIIKTIDKLKVLFT